MHCLSCNTPTEVNRLGVVTNGEFQYDVQGNGGQARFMCRSCSYPATPVHGA